MIDVRDVGDDRNDEFGRLIKVMWSDRIITVGVMMMMMGLAGLMAVARFKAAAMMTTQSKDDSFVI